MNKKLVGAAVVGAAILVVAAALVWGGTDEAPAAAPPPSTPPPSTVHGALEVYRDAPDSAIEIPVPSGWAVTRDHERASFQQGDLLLETDRVPITQEDALSGLQATVGRQGGTVVDHAPIAERDAAEWDFTYERGGVPRRVTVIGLGAGDALVTIRFDAPAADFERDRSVFDKALKIS
ncbi:hypothetical protein [Amycolatopsis sp. WQ 127309]|uniref:hypothetical protein n=1 Tax=Amycolatopsis sp. WQ 127309 TaxID=2932773 RepID=UPI001FF68348|nr:hypothetical protein [Amycolatopsis sp. WQ 127309]UOZ08102.1 hypothetical protein MUY22_07445 [Amycolatopsis sp. WQ 127309]